MSLKNIALTFAALFVVASATKANDLMTDLENMDLASINESAADVEEFDLDSLDIDQLAENAGDDNTDAIEACFRRFGYRRGGWGGWGGYRHCGFRSFGGCYSYYRPVCCYRPVIHSCYTHCYPVITRYWGCY